MYRAFLLDNAALRTVLRLAHVLLDQAHALDDHAVLPGVHLENLSSFPLLGPGNHHHHIVFFHMTAHQSTSGASESIFMKFLSRNSRATGPKMRVPRGFICASMITI